jgi:hypothetical protein
MYANEYTKKLITIKKEAANAVKDLIRVKAQCSKI